jgi:hypothetical protein
LRRSRTKPVPLLGGVAHVTHHGIPHDMAIMSTKSRPLPDPPAGTDVVSDALRDVGAALLALGAALQRAGMQLKSHPPDSRPVAPSALPPDLGIIGAPLRDRCVRLWDIVGRAASKGRPAIQGIIPVSRSAWYAGVKSGRFPQPIKCGRTAMWMASREVV